MRFRLRTLLIVLALGPPILAVAWPLVAKLLYPPKLAAPDTIYDSFELPEP